MDDAPQLNLTLFPSTSVDPFLPLFQQQNDIEDASIEKLTTNTNSDRYAEISKLKADVIKTHKLVKDNLQLKAAIRRLRKQTQHIDKQIKQLEEGFEARVQEQVQKQTKRLKRPSSKLFRKLKQKK